MSTDLKRKFIVNVVFFGLLAVIIYLLAKFLFVYLFPLIIGTLITVTVQKPATYISRRTNIKKGYCAVMLVVIIYLLLVSVLTYLVFKASNYFYNFAIGNSNLFGDVGSYVDKILGDIDELLNVVPQFIREQIPYFLKNILESLINALASFTKNIIKSAPMFLTGSLVTFLASCYIAKDYDRFKDSILSVMSDKYKIVCYKIKLLFKDNISKLLLGYLKLLLITFLELMIGLLLLGEKHSILLSGAIAILDMLPIFGTGTALIPWGLYNLISGNIYFGAGLLILYLIIVVIRNVIEPRIIGKQIGLHPLIALVCVFIGLKLFGILGVFLVPFTVMFLYKLYENGTFDILLSKQSEIND